MSFNKNLVVAAGFTLALLVASSYGGGFSGAIDPSYGGITTAGKDCYYDTEAHCNTDARCRYYCLKIVGDRRITGGYCFKPEKAPAPTCRCTMRCDGAKSSRHGTAAPASST